MEPEFDLHGSSTFAPSQRKPVKQVHSGDEIEGVTERSLADLGGNLVLARLHGGGVTVKAVGQEPATVDLENRHGWETIPGFDITLDREFVELVPQVQIRVEDELVDR